MWGRGNKDFSLSVDMLCAMINGIQGFVAWSEDTVGEWVYTIKLLLELKYFPLVVTYTCKYIVKLGK